ncbi:MFS transporter [Parvularcula sp. LCG005]|uniref:MFS transporter n=1 Tax=Parvularcula sp. LCG005 TaxID=3078805 RepID=UPI002943F782|nr:MFS transporter [Parvularcula sp. LCG005]WOI54700.1 MFS transporter [Parvularcula sp. LCG005]
MRIVLSLWPLLIAAAMLLSANGLQSTVLALRGISEGFPDAIIGLLHSAYFIGFIAGCRFAPRFIGNVGHIRAFTAFASVASAAAIMHAMFISPIPWLVLRIVTGFCFAALQMILESWLNDKATNQTRGQILSIYRITDFTAVTIAQLSIALFNMENFIVFAVLSVGLSLALVPVALTPVEAPVAPSRPKLDLARIWRVSPVAFAGAVGVGMTASAYWAMGAVFVTSFGYQAGAVGAFIGAIILGGALAQWPIGYISDRIDRRRVLVGASIGAALSAGLMMLSAQTSQTMLIINAMAFGVFALPNFGLAVAHANDHAEPGSGVQVNGGLLMLYGLAAIVGSVIAPTIMSWLGNDMLFSWIAFVYVLLAGFCLYRMTQRAAPPVQEPYVAVPRTSPTIYALDPRAAPLDEEDTVPMRAPYAGDDDSPGPIQS